MTTPASRGRVVALCGGVGGAKLALGLYHVLAPDALSVIVNTGDDFDHLGLRICPDVDTVLYTLAGANNPQTGWGRADETWSFMQELERLGGPTWFRLGDRDMALHVLRTLRLRDGDSLSAIIDCIRRQWGIRAGILPMSDDTVTTNLRTDQGSVPFQHYFVRLHCEPAVAAIEFEGAGSANPGPGVINSLRAGDLSAVVICPSNPFLSVDPILAVPGVREALTYCPAPVVAVSPIVAGAAVKGPTAKIMRELGIEPTPMAIEAHYAKLLDGFVYDTQDEDNVTTFTVPAFATRTIMNDLGDRAALARDVLDFAGQLDRRAPGVTEKSTA